MEEAYRITDEWKLYMYLLRCAIRGEEEDEEILKQYREISVQSLLDKAYQNGQHLLMMSYISKFNQYVNKDSKAFALPPQLLVKQYAKYKCIRNILQAADEKDILLIIFKGCILADLYPQYIQRISCDTDILVAKEDKIRAEELLTGLGYTKNIEKSNPEVQVYQLAKPVHNVELHTCLWEDYTGRRLDILQEMHLDAKEKLVSLEACGIPMTTLGYEEHLIFQIFHIIKHFSLQGVGIKYLTDITLYVEKYGQYIDYDSFWHNMKKLGYDKFCYEFFSLCVEWLGMKPDILNGHKYESGIERKLLLEDMFQLGITYEDKTAGWQILGMMTPYFVGEKSASKSSTQRKLQVIFPKASDLPDEYSYAKRIPILLPLAWGHKAIRYLIRYYKNRKTWYSVNEKLDVAEKRIALMDSLGLLEAKQ